MKQFKEFLEESQFKTSHHERMSNKHFKIAQKFDPGSDEYEAHIKASSAHDEALKHFPSTAHSKYANSLSSKY